MFLIKYSEHFIYEYCVYIISISLSPLQLFLPTPQIHNLLFNYYRYTHIYSFLVKFPLSVLVYQSVLSLYRSSLDNHCNLLVQLPCSSSEIFSPLLLRYFPWALEIGVALQKLLYRLGMLWSFSLCMLVSCGSLLQEAPFMRSGSYTDLEISCFLREPGHADRKIEALLGNSSWLLLLGSYQITGIIQQVCATLISDRFRSKQWLWIHRREKIARNIQGVKTVNFLELMVLSSF